MFVELSEKAKELKAELEAFMSEHVYPNERELLTESRDGSDRWAPRPLALELQAKARERGLWNLFYHHGPEGAGLSNYEYSFLCEALGRSLAAPELFNCNAPDVGNMELLATYGTLGQQARWLKPLLEAEIRSCFAMTEPRVASSDATNIETAIVRDGDDYVVTGRKWWITGAMSPRCKVAIVMGKSDPSAPTHVRVPAENMLLGEGRGFEIAQGRLGPGRIHHCMRFIGLAERALESLCIRAKQRTAFRSSFADMGAIRQAIGQSRCDIEQARLITLKAAWTMDAMGNKAARRDIAVAKIVVPTMAGVVIDRAIQVHGGAGLSQDFFLAEAFAETRFLRIGDGPDEVHREALARMELALHG
jgi:acyl-CoA dehydrogenase